MYSISELNGVKIYNLSAGKSTTQFIEEATVKKTSLRYNKDFRRRVELIQDFDFPASSSRVKISEDQQYIIASGLYAPQIKVFETTDLSMKCMRGMDSEIIDFTILGSDYSKLAFIGADRSVEFHAQFGRHYKTRVPKFPRKICFNPHTCDLIVAGSSEEIWRLSLDEGKFLQSMISDSQEINALDYNPYLNVLMTGGHQGAVETWDYRERSKVNKVIANRGADITSLIHDNSGFLFASGSQDGLVRLYDLRYSSHILEVQHPYKLPIKSVKFHEASKNLISVDKKQIKIYNKSTGKIFTNIESNSDINDIELVADSGLILVANDNPRIGTYFIPELGPAPKWSPYLENITEELEENMTSTVYDEYKFVTKDDLEALNATNLIGTKNLKQYLHGFLMRNKLYEKLKNIHDPFAYEKYRKERIKKELEKKYQNRIVIPSKKPKVNEDFLEQLQKQPENKKSKVKTSDLINDPRFKGLFTKEDFEIDINSEAYRLNHPTAFKKHGRIREADGDSEGNVSEDEEQKAIIQKIKAFDEKKKSPKLNFEERLKQEKANKDAEFKNKRNFNKKKLKV